MVSFASGCASSTRDEHGSTAMGAAAGEDASRALGAELVRDAYANRMSRALSTAAGDGWRAQVVILGNPEPDTRPGADADAWRWSSAAVTVSMSGEEGAQRPRIDAATIENFVRRVMAERMEKTAAEDPEMLMVVVRERQPGRSLAAPGAAAPAEELPQVHSSTPQVIPPASLQAVMTEAGVEELEGELSSLGVPDSSVYRGPVTHYTVQPGDTWAEISIAFYGTPNLWRLILSANPDLAARDLVPGRRIRVPSEFSEK